MKIIELKERYPKVYARAMQNCDSGYTEKDFLSIAFTWDDTEEGGRFWACIVCGDFAKAETICPKLFINVPEEKQNKSLTRKDLLELVRYAYERNVGAGLSDYNIESTLKEFLNKKFKKD